MVSVMRSEHAASPDHPILPAHDFPVLFELRHTD